MERGELIVTTNEPQTVKRIKIASLIGSIAIAVLLIYSALTAEATTTQTMIFSVVIGIALVVIGVLNAIRTESYCDAYEHGIAGFAARDSGSKTDPFELPYEEIIELRRFKKRGMEKNLLICTKKAQYNIYCRTNQQELIQVLLSKISPSEEETE